MTQQKTSIKEPVTALYVNEKPINNIGWIVLLVTLVVFAIWASLAPLASSSVAPGVVIVKGNRKKVQHLDGGIVDKILIREGEVVKAGQPLIILNDTQVKAQLEIAKTQSIAFAAQVARLRAERDQLNQINFPKLLDDLSDLRVEEARLAENNVFRSNKKIHEGEVAVLHERLGQISSKIEGLRGQVESKKQLLASYAEEIKDLKDLLAEGFADKQRLRDLERNYSLQSGELAQLHAEIATSGMLLSETRLQILQVEKDFQKEVAEKLTEALARLNDATERVNANQDILSRIVITAPSDGMVLGLSVHNENSVIPAGQPILEIVPQNSELVIDAQVNPIDIDKVSVGLQAEVRFSAFRQAEVPKMKGKVIYLSADRITDEKTGNAYYRAFVELDPESYKDLGGMELLPGMPAEAVINLGERTLIQYLTRPITEAFVHSFVED